MNVKELVEEYKENYSLRAMIFQFMKWRKRFSDLSYIVLLFVTALLVLSIPITFILLDVSIARTIAIAYGIVLIITFASVAWFVYSAKEIMHKHHGIQPKDGGWRPKAFDDFHRQKVIIFLTLKNVYTPEKLRNLAFELRKCIEKNKESFIGSKGASIPTLIVNLCSALIGYLFGKMNGWNVDDVVLVCLAAIVGLILIQAIIRVVQRIFFFNKDIFMPHNPNIILEEFLEHVEALILICEEPREVKKNIPIIIIP